MCLSASCVASWNALLLLKMELWSCYRNTMVRTHLLFLFFFFSSTLLYSSPILSFFFFGFSLLFLLFSMFSLLFFFFLHLCSIPSLAFYNKRMHVFSLIIKTFRTIIAGVMVTVNDGRGVCFFLLLYAE